MTSARGWASALMIIALAGGGYLRFTSLDGVQLSADEAASWAAAVRPSVAEVLRLQAHLNPGELGLHDLALHFWIDGFGDGVAVMRTLSAIVGVIAIALVFVVTREMLALEGGGINGELNPWANDELIAGLAALLFAVNLVSIKYSREARMYPPALALTLAQVWFFLRAIVSGSRGALAGFAVFSAGAIAATFTSILILVPEGLFLVLARTLDFPRLLRFGVAVVIAVILLTPLGFLYWHNRAGAPPNLATWNWIQMPAPWATITLFNKATGTYAFPLLAILAFSGAVRAWTAHREAVLFLVLWMLIPPIALTVGSYLFHPAFVERYLLACFAPFFMLAALGIVELNPVPLRPGALAIVIALGLAHVQDWREKPHGEDWAGATAIATKLKRAGVIEVAPHYAGNVVRYYLEREHAALTVADSEAPAADIAIIADGFAKAAMRSRDYPQLIAHPRGIEVRTR